MAIKDLPKYKDIRGSIRRKGRYPIAKVGSLVGLKAKDTHVVHHSMTAQHLKGSTPQAFANTHIDTNKWQGIAYAFVIMPDGTIYHCDDLDRRTNHAGNTNDRSVGTCVVGDFRKEGAAEKPTKEQMQSLYLLNKELYKECPNMKRTIGHQECPGYSWKNCPGDTWSYKDVIAGKGIENKEELTMNQAQELQKQIDELKKQLASKVDKKVDVNTPSDWGEENWTIQTKQGYYDGSRPKDNITREEDALVISRVVDNIRKYVAAPLEKRIQELENQLQNQKESIQ